MMKPDTILSSDLLDILFDNRNKEYGAYLLRKEYHHRLLIALGSIPVVIVLFLWMNYLNKAVHADMLSTLPATEDVVVKQIEIEKPLPEPQEVLKQKPVATIRNTPPVIVADEAKADPPPPADDLLKDDRAISNITQEGAPTVSATSAVTAEPAETQTAAPAPEPETVWSSTEVMPEYPGGVDALRRFLGRNLRVPENVIEAGLPQGGMKVPVRFVVNKSGELSDVEFLVQANESVKQEILRVMHKMPKWKPGSQNGRNVAVYFTIPIVFQVGE